MALTINFQENLPRSIRFPISKMELLEGYGEVPLSYIWENDTLILLKDILQSAHTDVFNSQIELELALRKMLRRYKM